MLLVVVRLGVGNNSFAGDGCLVDEHVGCGWRRRQAKGRAVITTQGLTHLHLFVADLDRSLRFYQEVFGFEELFRDGPKMVLLKPPNSSDTITLNEKPARAGAAGGIDHFGFRLTDKADLDDAIEEVEKAGGRLITRGEHAPGQTYAYVSDPDGYTIEL